MNGEFTLSGVPAKGTLVISFIGYQTQEIQVNNQQKLSINLKEDSQQLQEVVVGGSGLRRCPPQRPDRFHRESRHQGISQNSGKQCC